MGKLDGKVALVTGGARGQGRAHALRLAEEGADIIGVDLVGPVDSVGYPLASPHDLDDTVALVEKAGKRILAFQADVRDQDGLDDAVAKGVAELGGIDIVCANAGIATFAQAWRMPEVTWQDMIDINLTGVWHTVKATAPIMIEAGRGGSMVLTSSVAGLRGMANISHYSSAKHGLVGLMQSLALELAPHRIRVNTVHPTNVNTPMIMNDQTFGAFRSGAPDASEDEVLAAMTKMQALEIPWVESIDVSNAVLWLSSDEARYVTGVSLPIDAGMTLK